MNTPRFVAVRLFSVPLVIVGISIALLFFLKPLTDGMAEGPLSEWAQPVLFWGLIVMLVGYAVGGIWLVVGMWRFLGWLRGDLEGDCPRCRGHLKAGSSGERSCPLCGYRDRR